MLLPLTEKYLGIKIKDSQELKDKLQTTIEKEPDFLRIVRTDTDEEFILHLEFQTRDEEGMVYRMQEYYGLLRRKHGLPVKQFVPQRAAFEDHQPHTASPPQSCESFHPVNPDLFFTNLCAALP